MGSSSRALVLRGSPKHRRELPLVGYKPKTAGIVTKDMIWELLIPQKKPPASLIFLKKEYDRIKAAARALEERWVRLKPRQDAAFEALKKAQIEEQRRAEEWEKKHRRKDVEDELQREEQKLLQRAARMRLEQDEEMRELNAIFLNAKCNMIRDKQVLEKRMIHKELAEEELRLDKMMEMEREKGIEIQEELERRKREELIRARQDMEKEMEQNVEEWIMKAEELYQEGQKLLENLEQMKKEDQKAWEKKQEGQRQIHAEIKHFNMESQRLQDEQRERERQEEKRALEQQRQKAEHESTMETGPEQLHLEKEKELLREFQAEWDAMMGKLRRDPVYREWRRRELGQMLRKGELEQRLRWDRLEQAAQRKHYLAKQVEQDRQEFHRVLRAHQEQLQQEQLDSEKPQREKPEKARGARQQQRPRSGELRPRLRPLQQQQGRARAAVTEQGRGEKEVQQHNQRLGQLKLQEFRPTGIAKKLCALAARKARD